MAESMAKINLVLSDKLEKEFREEVFKRYGMKKGNIRKAVEEALKKWIQESWTNVNKQSP
jgi:hypothetical protein